jgi:pimeloyl-ACP methyl ester carboxylesterase
MKKGRGALIAALGLAAATVGVAAMAPELVLAAEFARQRRMAGARRYAIELAAHRWSYLDAGRVKSPRTTPVRSRAGLLAPPLTKPVVVLVHGFTGSKENWLPLMGAMASNYRLIAPDLPGWGDSERLRDGDYGAIAQVERLAKFLRALPGIVGVDGPPALLVGHSMGGQIVGLLAARYPELVDRIALVSSSGVLFEENEFGAGVLAGENPFSVSNREELHRYLSIVFQKPPFVPWPFDEALVQRRRESAAFEHRVLEDIGRGADAFALQKELAAIRAPTLLLWGSEDRVIDPSAIAVFEAGLERSRSVVLNGCGHMPMMERTIDTANALRDFLR